MPRREVPLQDRAPGLGGSLLRAIDRGVVTSAQVVELLECAELGNLDQVERLVAFAQVPIEVAPILSGDRDLRPAVARLLRTSAGTIEFAGQFAAADIAWLHYRRFAPNEDAARAAMGVLTLRHHLLRNGVGVDSPAWIEQCAANIEAGISESPNQFIVQIRRELTATLALAMLAEGAFTVAMALASEVAHIEGDDASLPVGNILVAAVALRTNDPKRAMAALQRWRKHVRDPRSLLLMPLVQTMEAEVAAIEEAIGGAIAVPRPTIDVLAELQGLIHHSGLGVESLAWVLANIQLVYAYSRLPLGRPFAERLLEKLKDKSDFARFGLIRKLLGLASFVSTGEAAGPASVRMYQFSVKAREAALLIDWAALGFGHLMEIAAAEGNHFDHLVQVARQEEEERAAQMNVTTFRAICRSIAGSSDLTHLMPWRLAAARGIVGSAKNAWLGALLEAETLADALAGVPGAPFSREMVATLGYDPLREGASFAMSIATILLEHGEAARDMVRRFPIPEGQQAFAQNLYMWLAATDDIHKHIDRRAEALRSEDTELAIA